MKITIFGTGYVGLTQAACLAEVGHSVCCVDVDERRIAQLNQGHSPIHEPGLDALLQGNLAAGRLRFTTEAAEGVAYARVIFIAVGTPPDEDGSADMQYVFAVADSIAATAVLAMGEAAEGTPLVLVRGAGAGAVTSQTARDALRPAAEDLFR